MFIVIMNVVNLSALLNVSRSEFCNSGLASAVASLLCFSSPLIFLGLFSTFRIFTFRFAFLFKGEFIMRPPSLFFFCVIVHRVYIQDSEGCFFVVVADSFDSISVTTIRE